MSQPVVVHPKKSSTSINTIISAEQLKQAVAQQEEQRQIIRDFVRSQLESGKDFGTIEITNRSGHSTQSKPILFKSGMEKIFALFNIVSTLERDTETVEMIGKTGIIAYKCKLYRQTEFIAEGRGACAIDERGRVNDAIKIAEKRARVDACLSLGFSEYFTQDLDDQTDVSTNASLKDQPVSSESTDVTANWRDGEVRDLTFTVTSKEMKSAQSGTTYALLRTDIAPLKAWKNTFSRLEEGKTYRAAVEGTIWNNALSLVVIRIYQNLD